MSARITLATARRVLLQLRHDPRTIALLLVAPIALITVVKYVFWGSDTFDRIGGPLLGLFPLLSMFLVTSIAMLPALLFFTLAQRRIVGGLTGAVKG